MNYNYFSKKHGFMLAMASVLSLNALGQTTHNWTGTAGDGLLTTLENWDPIPPALDNTTNLIIGNGATVLHNNGQIFKGDNNSRRASIQTETGTTLTINKNMMISASPYLNGTINITNTDYDGVENLTTELNSRVVTYIGASGSGTVNVGTPNSTFPTSFYVHNVLSIGSAPNGATENLGNGVVNVYKNGRVVVNNVFRLSHTRNASNGTLNMYGGEAVGNVGMHLGENNSLSTGHATINLFEGSVTIATSTEIPRAGGNTTGVINIYNGNFTTSSLAITNNLSKIEFKINSDNSAPTGKLKTGTTTRAELQAFIDAGKIVKPANYDWVWDETAGVTLSVVPQTSPVEIISFNANSLIDGIKLDWSTASETDNAGFVIEHSTDGKNFSVLNTVEGNNRASIYSYIHNTPSQGTNYYRLTQSDVNGTKTVIGIKSVNFNLSDNSAINVYPNPSSDIINVSVKGGVNDVKTVRVLDLNGKLVLATSGTDSTIQLNTKGKLAPGVYTVTVSTDNINESKKIVIE
ncbi:T9SS C-terminal target domain-containing protein [Pseudoxanthomonas sp. SGD-10]|nr:T9SS C-terminal target domain-containing protein [Pseudoxanthomonas sp. SGD-10]